MGIIGSQHLDLTAVQDAVLSHTTTHTTVLVIMGNEKFGACTPVVARFQALVF